LAVALAAKGKNRTRFYSLAERRNGTCVALRYVALRYLLLEIAHYSHDNDTVISMLSIAKAVAVE